MSRISQSAALATPVPFQSPWPGDVVCPVMGMANERETSSSLPAHRHEVAQLLFASRGMMRVTTDAGAWIVPPELAVWLPAGQSHQVHCLGLVSMRSLYFRPDVAAGLPEPCRVILVSPLLREVIVALVEGRQVYRAEDPETRLVTVLLDLVSDAPEAPLRLPLPSDRRLKPVTDQLLAEPADGRTLADWATVCGASERTLARLFDAETGMTFNRWRQQVRLQAALSLLGQGNSVTSAALEVGYDSPSAFIAMFRRLLGETPRQYLERMKSARSA